MHCGKKEIGYVACPNNHYICNDCHGKTASDLILQLSLKAQGINPVVIAEDLLAKTNVAMLGCEHALIATGSLLAAIKNEGSIKLSEQQISDAFERTKKQAIAAYCGLTGVCGIAPAIGASFSVILGAACPKDQETANTMHVVAQIITCIANETGPKKKKNFLRTSLIKSCELAEHFLKVKLNSRVNIICQDYNRHPHGCRMQNCSYYSGD